MNVSTYHFWGFAHQSLAKDRLGSCWCCWPWILERAFQKVVDMFSQSLSSLLESQFIHFSLSGSIKISESLCTNRKLIFEIEYFIFGRLKQRCQENSKGKIFQQIEKRLQTPICYFKSSCEPNIVCLTVKRTLAFNKSSKVCLIFNRWVFTVGAAELRLLITPGLLFSRSLQNSKQIIHHQTDLSKVKVYLYPKAFAD